MLLIPCPFCGPRAEIEFTWGGEIGVTPTPAVSDADWCDYLYVRANPLGIARERWVHAAGCRQWFVVERNTLTHEILNSLRLDSIPAQSET